MKVEITKITEIIFKIIENGKFSIALLIAIIIASLSPYLVTTYSLFIVFKSTYEKYELVFIIGVLVFTFLFVYWSIYLLIKSYGKLKSYIKGIIQRRIDKSAMLKFLEALEPQGIAILREFKIQKKNIVLLDRKDKWVEYLHNMRVLKQHFNHPLADGFIGHFHCIEAFQLTEIAKKTLVDTMINYSEENGEPSKWVMSNRPEWVKLLEPKKPQPIRRPTHYR